MNDMSSNKAKLDLFFCYIARDADRRVLSIVRGPSMNPALRHGRRAQKHRSQPPSLASNAR